MKNFALFLIIVILFSCGRNKNITSTDEIITVDLLTEADMPLINLSDISAEIDYIPLQTVDSSLIGRIVEVIMVDDKIYLNDDDLSILCFDRNGNFIHRLSKVGRGPGEYSFISDFDVSSDGKKLIILTSGKILAYNINGNKLIFSNSIDIEGGAIKAGFIPGTDNILLSKGPWLGGDIYLSLVINLEGDTLLAKPNVYKYENTGMGFFSAFDAMQYKLGDKVCFKEVFSDTIFYVDSKLKGFIPHLVLDSHGTIPPPRVREDPEYRMAHANDFSSVAVAYELPGYLFYHYMYKGTQHKILYDKTRNIKYELDVENGLKDDIVGGPAINLGMQNCTGSFFYATVDAIDFKQYGNSGDFSTATVISQKKKEEFGEIIDSLDEMDNPVLIIVTPKE